MTNSTPTHAAVTTAVTTTVTDISLAKLVPSPANVRRTGAGTGIEALAASIQAHGLLQSLVVRPQLDATGRETDRHEVVAGGRRLAALRLLAKRKRIAKNTAIPCRVLDGAGRPWSRRSGATCRAPSGRAHGQLPVRSGRRCRGQRHADGAERRLLGQRHLAPPGQLQAGDEGAAPRRAPPERCVW